MKNLHFFLVALATATTFLLGVAYGQHKCALRQAYACAEANSFVRNVVERCYTERGLEAPKGQGL